MNKKLLAFALPALMFAGTAAAGQLLIDFDGQNEGFFRPFDPYQLTIVNGNDYPGSGFSNVAVFSPGVNVGHNYNESTAVTFASASGVEFKLNSFVMAGAWGSQTPVVIKGYKGGVEVYSTDISITTTATTFSSASSRSLAAWDNYYIDSFTISIADSVYTPTPGSGQIGKHWALDDVRVTPVPEPETYVMLLAGLGIMGAVARRRQSGRA